MDYRKVKKHFKKFDSIIYGVMQALDFDEWLKPHKESKYESYFVALTREIIGQQLSGAAARTIYTRFTKLLRGKITPEKILRVPDEKLRSVGMSWAKARYVKNIAEAFLKKEIVASHFEAPDEEVIAKLTEIKGIGCWTAEMFLIFTLGREDVFSHGDLGLRKGIEKVYDLKNPTKEKVEKIIAPWSPYKSYGSIALWHSLEK